MSAPIVVHLTRAPFAADLAARVADEQAETLGIPSISIAGDQNVKARIDRPAGQLWERVAEASEKSFRYTWRGGMPRGPRFTLSDMSGIIRAGVRVK